MRLVTRSAAVQHGEGLRRSLTLLATAVAFGTLLVGAAHGAPGDVAIGRVADVNPGTNASVPTELTNVNGTLLFIADDGMSGEELWKSDGTTAGTTLVEDIRTGPMDSFITELTNVNGTLFFAALTQADGAELWKSEPPYDAASTQIVEDIKPGDQCSCPLGLVNVNGTLFFAADNGLNGEELWKSTSPYNGATTDMVEDINIVPDISASSTPQNLTNVNGTLLFDAIDGVASDGSGGSEGELWKSVGPAFNNASTSLVEDIGAGSLGALSFEYTAVGNTLYFNADDSGTNGPELWKSSGPAFDGASTSIVEDIRMGSTGSFPGGLTNVNGTLFFTADDGSNGQELWKSTDGTAAGTDLVEDIRMGITGSQIDKLTNVNGILYFRANDGTSGVEPWRSTDGTAAGTSMVVEIRAGPSASDPDFFIGVDGAVFFRGNEGTLGDELFKTDGTPGGTSMVADIYPGGSGSYLNELINVNGTLFFRAADTAADIELWKATIEGPAPPSTQPASPTKKRCKKGRKLKKGKCVKKKRKKKK